MIEFNSGDGDTGRVDFRPGAWGQNDMLEGDIVSGEESPFSRCLLARWAITVFDIVFEALPDTS